MDNPTTIAEPAFIDTNNTIKKNYAHRVAIKESDDNTSRVSYTNIPKRIEALFILFADHRDVGGATLTREELDLNPRTKKLPKSEKDLLVKYWPVFDQNREVAQRMREEREARTLMVMQADKDANKLAKKTGMGRMDTAMQIAATRDLLAQQALKASLSLAVMDPEAIFADEMMAKVYKLRVTYVKDFIGLHESLARLGQRIEEYTAASNVQFVLNDEAAELLRQADERLLGGQRGE